MLTRIQHGLQIAFGREAQKDTAQGRSRQRYRRALWASGTRCGATIVNVICNLAMVPIGLGYLGPDMFGLWMTLASFVAFLQFADLGLGIGIQNALADYLGKENRERPAYVVSSGLAALLIISMLFVLSAVFVVPRLGLHSLIRTESADAARALIPTAQATLLAFAAVLPATMLQRVFNAYQRAHVGHVWMGAGSLLSFGGVILAIELGAPLPVLVFVLMGGKVAPMFVGSTLMFARDSSLRPSLRKIDKRAMRRIWQVGGWAFLRQVGNCVVLALPVIMVANLLGTSDAGKVAISLKLASTAMFPVMAILLALWPAYSEAAARGDWAWVQKTYRRTQKLWGVVAVPSMLLLITCGRPLIRLWTDSAEVVPSFWLLSGCAALWALNVLNGTMGVLLGALHHLKWQAIYGTVAWVGAVGFVAWVGRYMSSAGIVWLIVAIAYGLRAGCLRIEIARRAIWDTAGCDLRAGSTAKIGDRAETRSEPVRYARAPGVGVSVRPRGGNGEAGVTGRMDR